MTSWRFNLGDKVQYARQGTLHVGIIVARGPWKGPDEQCPAWYGVRTYRENAPKDIPIGTVAYANWLQDHWHLRRHFNNVRESELEVIEQ